MANQYVNKVNLADGTSIIDISDTTATADKILQGYGAYGKDGAWMNGTAVSGGGLEYETGTWTPTEDVNSVTINFTNTHTTMPAVIVFSDATGTSDNRPTYTLYGWLYICYELINGTWIPGGATNTYGSVMYLRRTTGSGGPTSSGTGITHSVSDLDDSTTLYPRYWVSENHFYVYGNNASVMLRTGRTYKWMAAWVPTT